MASTFPTDPLKLTWTPPTVQNGPIVQYIVVVQNPTDNKCIFWLTTLCSDCVPNVVGPIGETSIKTGCTQVTYTNKFSTALTSITVSPSSELIIGGSNFKISVIPVNGYGWGTLSTKTETLPQYISGSVTNLAMTSTFPTDPMKLTWTPPTVQNGPITQYLVVVQNPSNDQCIFWFTTLCSDCVPNVVGTTGETSIRNGGTPVTYTNKFSKTSTSITVSPLSPLITGTSHFKISVVPVNGYGWGTLSMITETLPPYASGPIASLTLSSTFPTVPMKLTWTPPLVNNGQIVQYIVVAQNPTDKKCKFWLTTSCSDCINGIPGTTGDTTIRAGCTEIVITDTFLKAATSITVSPTSPLIFAFTMYQLSVVPVNAYGWGSITPNNLMTNQYISESVTSITMTSTYPNDLMKLTWKPPVVHNGQIVQYIVVAQNPTDNKCVFWFTTSCSNCVPNVPGTIGETNIHSGCTQVTFTNTFSSASTSITVSPSSTLININTQYKISVIPVNGYGWGALSETTKTTTDYISGQISNLAMTSTFPSDPLKLTWAPPTVKNGTTTQYIVVAQNPTDNKCKFWFSTSCSDCTPNVAGTIGDTNIRNGCPSIAFTKTFLNTETSITVSPSSLTLIIPVTQYKISVVPVNGYGWGAPSTIIETTNQYISQSVTNIIMTSSYPNDPMKLTWKPPLVHNGQIVQYIVIAQTSTDKKCKFWFTTSCSDCTPNVVGTIGDKTIISGCLSITITNTFLTTSASITVSPSSELITSKTSFLISVVPVNGYGWGTISSITQETPFTSQFVTNIMMTSSYPNDPMKLTWGKASVPNGQIVQYIVVVQNPTDSKCVFWFTTNCSDCTNNIFGTKDDTGIRDGCPPVTFTNTFSNNLASLTVSPLSELITPKTQFKISVIPLNGYGWGTISSITQTTPFTSGFVTNLIMTSSYPTDPMKLTWVPPTEPNGQITQYLVVVQNISDNKCVFYFTTICNDCTNLIIGSMNDTNIRANCQLVPYTIKYATTSKSITVSPSSQVITPNTTFTISVVPINGYGWGNISSINQATPYTSEPVTSVTMRHSYPNDPIILTWTPPSVPYGQIVQYIFVVQNTYDNTCVFWLTTLCSDCTNDIFGTKDDTNIRTGCPQLTFTNKFSTKLKSITVTPFSPIFTANTKFKVSVIPLNGYGFGTFWTMNITTPYISEPVLQMTTTSSNPNLALNLNWIPPLLNYGEINQYIILVQSPSTGFCVTWASMNCSDCSNKNIGTLHDTNNRINCPNFAYSTPFSTVSNSLSFSLTFSPEALIIPNTQYNISVIGVNGYGWGNVSSIISTINPYISGSVISLTMTSLYPKWPMNFTWETPLVNNGQITQYIILILNSTDYSCIAWSTTNCGDCTNKNIGTIGDTNIRKNCKEIVGTTPFYYKSTIVSVSLLPSYSLISANTLYNISVVPVNGYGWGNVSSINHTTDQLRLPGFENQTAVNKQMNMTKRVPSQNEIPINLPFSLITSSDGVTKVNLFVGVTGKNANQNSSVEKTYSQCNKGLDCKYTIPLTLPASNNLRRKRATTLYSDVEFMIGDSSSCSNGCNGPLNPSTAYDIGFQVCNPSGCMVTTSQRSTTVDLTSLIVCIVVFVLVSIMCIIAGVLAVVLVRRRDKTRIWDDSSTKSSDNTYFNDLLNVYESYYWTIKQESNEKAYHEHIEANKIQKKIESGFELAYMDGEAMKNQYNNVIPYKHNTIVLEGAETYINASRICIKHPSPESQSECTCTDCYIAAEGPLGDDVENKSQTIGDFWKMVLQRNVSMIVNLTKCVESYELKCAQYWPEDVKETESYVSGDKIIQVTLQRIRTTSTYDERTLLVSMDNSPKIITQLQFTAWDDHSCPDILEFLDFYTRYHDTQRYDEDILVHCSAGVRRTGTFILIDLQIKEINLGVQIVDIFKKLLKLRECQSFMVQTEKQYVFVHDVIYEYLKRKAQLERGELTEYPEVNGIRAL